MKGKGFLILGGLILSAWGAWAAAGWVKPLALMPQATAQLLTTSADILEETRALQGEVARVRGHFAELERQDKLLAEQERLTRSALSELKRQRTLAEGATGRLEQLLAEERRTAVLTAEAGQAGQRNLAVSAATAEQMQSLVGVTGRVSTASQGVDSGVDSLIGELERSAETFAVIGRLKSAVGAAADRTVDWWRRLRDWLPW